MKFNFLPPLLRQFAFLPRNEAIKTHIAGSDGKQYIWSKLCTAAVESMAKKINSGAISCAESLVEEALRLRLLIAIILNHDSHYQKLFSSVSKNQAQKLKFGISRKEIPVRPVTLLGEVSCYIGASGFPKLREYIERLESIQNKSSLPSDISDTIRRCFPENQEEELYEQLIQFDPQQVQVKYNGMNLTTHIINPDEAFLSLINQGQWFPFQIKPALQIITVHTEPCQIQSTLQAANDSFIAALKGDPQKFLYNLGRLHWFISQTTPALRGGGSISNLCVQAVAAAHSLCLPPDPADLTVDIVALLTPDIEEFAQNYTLYFAEIDLEKAQQELEAYTPQGQSTNLWLSDVARRIYAGQIGEKEIQEILDLSLPQFYLYELYCNRSLAVPDIYQKIRSISLPEDSVFMPQGQLDPSALLQVLRLGYEHFPMCAPITAPDFCVDGATVYQLMDGSSYIKLDKNTSKYTQTHAYFISLIYAQLDEIQSVSVYEHSQTLAFHIQSDGLNLQKSGAHVRTIFPSPLPYFQNMLHVLLGEQLVLELQYNLFNLSTINVHIQGTNEARNKEIKQNLASMGITCTEVPTHTPDQLLLILSYRDIWWHLSYNPRYFKIFVSYPFPLIPMNSRLFQTLQENNKQFRKEIIYAESRMLLSFELEPVVQLYPNSSHIKDFLKYYRDKYQLDMICLEGIDALQQEVIHFKEALEDAKLGVIWLGKDGQVLSLVLEKVASKIYCYVLDPFQVGMTKEGCFVKTKLTEEDLDIEDIYHLLQQSGLEVELCVPYFEFDIQNIESQDWSLRSLINCVLLLKDFLRIPSPGQELHFLTPEKSTPAKTSVTVLPFLPPAWLYKTAPTSIIEAAAIEESAQVSPDKQKSKPFSTFKQKHLLGFVERQFDQSTTSDQHVLINRYPQNKSKKYYQFFSEMKSAEPMAAPDETFGLAG
ncbi:Avirulence protein (plasmid) [Legionella adelaidensis]|uniref:Avirulence protein n=1 Tax=Legionella adelaidensis TaxID=45056 RepID=A0A0W0R0Z0_9GAMM|nr:hypothetical protein [Legionella adelaidensis]KTC64743.1 Avirulence protein [Legionella adelaidensis]VEH81286.1 Avirulence protein [Legionella adelaidensis]